MENFNDYITTYKKQLEIGDIQKAYTGLIKCVMNLQTRLRKETLDKYIVGNLSPGYMDFSYFPFLNRFLKDYNLRFGIVLNHKEMRFELWLMGRNIEIQKKYWEFLKATKWNKDQINMPKYSVLEIVLVECPNFNQIDSLNEEIISSALHHSEEIIEYLKTS